MPNVYYSKITLLLKKGARQYSFCEYAVLPPQG